jgi:hypothetical protein
MSNNNDLGDLKLSPATDFEFEKEIDFEGETWKLYKRLEHKNPIFLCSETMVPYRPMNPILAEIKVIICGDKVKQWPESIAQNQKNIMCCSLEDPSVRKEFSF